MPIADLIPQSSSRRRPPAQKCGPIDSDGMLAKAQSLVGIVRVMVASFCHVPCSSVLPAEIGPLAVRLIFLAASPRLRVGLLFMVSRPVPLRSGRCRLPNGTWFLGSSPAPLFSCSPALLMSASRTSIVPSRPAWSWPGSPVIFCGSMGRQAKCGVRQRLAGKRDARSVFGTRRTGSSRRVADSSPKE
jgi:hypothetical protein